MNGGQGPALAVIILNWNGLADTLECLASLRRSTHLPRWIVVWDNGSEEDPAPALREFQEVTLLRSNRNVGFAAGCNRAAEWALTAGAEALLFLNNDTIVPTEMIATMIRGLTAAPRAGLIGVPEISFAQPNGPRRLGAQWRPSTCKVRWLYATSEEKLPEWLPLDVLSGCALMMDAATARRVGLFDETFFAYWEDVDLSLRVRQAGYQNYCATTTGVIHKGGRATGEGFTRAQIYLVCRGQALTVRKHARGWGRLTAPLWLGLSTVVSYFQESICPRNKELMRAKRQGFRDGWRQRPARLASFLPSSNDGQAEEHTTRTRKRI